jgi:hypothetical protein
VEHVPDLVKALKREDSASSKACLQTLAELMHLLMYQHSGFPELYGPVLDSLQVMYNTPVEYSWELLLCPDSRLYFWGLFFMKAEEAMGMRMPRVNA